MSYIERDTNRGFGQPVIKGTRLSVFNALYNAHYSVDINSFLDDFKLKLEELESAVIYCKERMCKQIKNSSDHYCNGCVLRSASEGWNSIQHDFTDIDSISISNDNKAFSLGTIEETDNDEFGIMGWLLAEAVEKKLDSG